MEAAIDTLRWYQYSKKAVQANRNMETTKDLVTFDPVKPVSVQATGMKKRKTPNENLIWRTK